MISSSVVRIAMANTLLNHIFFSCTNIMFSNLLNHIFFSCMDILSNTPAILFFLFISFSVHYNSFCFLPSFTSCNKLCKSDNALFLYSSTAHLFPLFPSDHLFFLLHSIFRCQHFLFFFIYTTWLPKNFMHLLYTPTITP